MGVVHYDLETNFRPIKIILEKQIASDIVLWLFRKDCLIFKKCKMKLLKYFLPAVVGTFIYSVNLLAADFYGIGQPETIPLPGAAVLPFSDDRSPFDDVVRAINQRQPQTNPMGHRRAWLADIPPAEARIPGQEFPGNVYSSNVDDERSLDKISSVDSATDISEARIPGQEVLGHFYPSNVYDEGPPRELLSIHGLGGGLSLHIFRQDSPSSPDPVYIYREGGTRKSSVLFPLRREHILNSSSPRDIGSHQMAAGPVYVMTIEGNEWLQSTYPNFLDSISQTNPASRPYVIGPYTSANADPLHVALQREVMSGIDKCEKVRKRSVYRRDLFRQAYWPCYDEENTRAEDICCCGMTSDACVISFCAYCWCPLSCPIVSSVACCAPDLVIYYRESRDGVTAKAAADYTDDLYKKLRGWNQKLSKNLAEKFDFRQFWAAG